MNRLSMTLLLGLVLLSASSSPAAEPVPVLKEATSFAESVTEGVEIVTDYYIRKVEPGDLIAAAITGVYGHVKVPLPADIAGRLKNVKSMDKKERTQLLTEARTHLGNRKDIEGDRAADVAIRAMLASLNDPYTEYYDRATIGGIICSRPFVGVGIELRRDDARDALAVVTTIKGGPAFKGQVQTGDIITEIVLDDPALQKDDQTVFSTRGMKVEDALNLVKGKDGTVVTLVVERNGKRTALRLVRDSVIAETVFGVRRNAVADWEFLLDRENRIGYVRMKEIRERTPDDFQAALDSLKRTGLNGLILDLRGNTGGYLTAAVRISEMLVGKEVIVTVRPRPGSMVGRERTYRGDKDGDMSFKLAVLVDDRTQRVGEIVAACLQDHKRAVVIGERSAGKWSVQDVVPVDGTRGELKLTIARYIPPNGRNLDKLAADHDKSITDWGVRPDREVKVTLDEKKRLDASMRDLELIPAPMAKRPEVSVEDDGQLKAALDALREHDVEIAPPPRPKGVTGVPLEKLSTEELIDRLREVSAQGIGTHATAWASGFLAVDEEPKFEGGIIGSAKPVGSPIMRELVRRGVGALPELLKHIDDKRPTKLVIEHESGFGAMWHSDEFDPRYANPKKQPAKVNTDKGRLPLRGTAATYTLRVSDLCFVAVGQIVNRNLSAVHYQPTACIVLNSPVQTPALAEAVRKDWSNLTAEQHKQSLIQDVYDKRPFATSAALKRLMFYYPKDGEAFAQKLLERPLYSDDAVWFFIQKRLIQEQDPKIWKSLVREFGREQGLPAAAAVPVRLRWSYFETSFAETKQFLADRERALKILADVFPEYDPYLPPFINGAEPREQSETIKAIGQVRSPVLDKTIHDLFVAAVKMKPYSEPERHQLDQLALDCIAQLVGKAYDAELRAYVSDRIKAVEMLPKGDFGKRTLDSLRELQKRLGK